MLRNVVAIERDGLSVRVFTITFDVPDKDFDLKTAVKEAATEFCRTEAGRKTYEYNCKSFNWADFVSVVPKEFCEKHGFKVVDSGLSDIIVDWDEHLVNDFMLGELEEILEEEEEKDEW